MKFSSNLNFCLYLKARSLFSGCKILALVKAVPKFLLTAMGPEFGPCHFGLRPAPCYLTLNVIYLPVLSVHYIVSH